MAILEIDKVSKTYGNQPALSDISLEVKEGSIFGLLGPNGAGKTTLIRIINQIIFSDSGEIRVMGEPLEPKHIQVIGYLPEERGLYKKMKVGEQLIYLAQLKGMRRPEAVTKIKSWFQRLDVDGWWDKNVEDLSKGMAQKIQFIATVIHEPRVLILDEPFSGFDPVNANRIKDEILKIRDSGTTIIFSTHRMESVEELCDHIALINKSRKILDGEKKAIKNEHKEGIFTIRHTNTLPADLSSSFSVIESGPTPDVLDHMIESRIKVNSGSPNELLQALTDSVEIHQFIEEVPSMNDIFISKVQEVPS